MEDINNLKKNLIDEIVKKNKSNDNNILKRWRKYLLHRWGGGNFILEPALLG